jgi:hypothetical protein
MLHCDLDTLIHGRVAWTQDYAVRYTLKLLIAALRCHNSSTSFRMTSLRASHFSASGELMLKNVAA